MNIRQRSPQMAVAAILGVMIGLASLRLQANPHVDKQGEGASMTILPLPTQPPKGAIQLFTGKAEQLHDNWYKRYSTNPAEWMADADGVASPKGGDITSKQEFGDCFLHVEFRTPASGEHGGNSGVGLQGRYEVQINDSYGKKPAAIEAGAFYSQKAPIVTASRPKHEWETYDIIFRAPRFDAAGAVTEKPRATVFQNGILVQNNEEFNGPTGIQYGEFKGMTKTGPLVLQGDHSPVQFRNVWIIPQ